MTSAMPSNTITRHGSPAFGVGAWLDLAFFAGLNFAINPIVASRFGRIVQESILMTRRAWVFLLFALAGCRRGGPPADLFPKTAAGGWRLTALRILSASDAPDPVPRSVVERVQIAAYDGPGKLEARAYELASPAAGADLQRRWQPSSDTVFFARAQYFIVVKWQSADRQALRDFVRDLETRIQPPVRQSK